MPNLLRKTVQTFRKEGVVGVARKARRVFFRVVRPFKDGVEGNLPLSSIPTDTRQVIILASVPFYDVGGGQRSAQLARGFFRMGYAVHYLFAQKSAESVVYTMDIPTVTHRYIGGLKPSYFEHAIRPDDIVIVEAPYKQFLPFIKKFKERGAKIVYENIDNWETSLGEGVLSRDALTQILHDATAFTATAKPLQQQLQEYLDDARIKGKAQYLPNAVDDRLFNSQKKYRKPKDLKQGGKTLLYYGSLWGQWFDWDVIDGIARQNPDFHVYLIGDNEHVKHKEAILPSNVHFLGAKLQAELPAYLAHTDIAMIPFKVDEIGEYVSPLKIFEYIAMNKVVLSTPLPDIQGYPNVFTGSTAQEWNKLLAGKTLRSADDKKRTTFLAENNWQKRCEQIIKIADDNLS